MSWFTQHGDLEMVQWFHAKSKEIGSSNVNLPIDQAASGGHLNLVQWLHDHDPHGCSPSAMNSAARHGSLEVVQWVHENRAEGCTVRAMDSAASEGHLHIVKWLHENRTEGCSTHAMDGAAESGHLEIVQWLHANRTEGCTSNAMNYAARGGHLQVVEWLHVNRTEGCTTWAMDWAAENGHLDVLKWLHANRTEACTTQAIENAAGNGYLEVVTWLHEHRSEGCTSQAIDRAALSGRLKVLEWLHANRSEGCTSGAMQRAAVNGHFEFLLFLHANRTEGCGLNTIGDSDRCLWNMEIVQWLYEKYPDAVDIEGLRVHGERFMPELLESLLLSTRQLETDLEAGRTLYNAIRSGATDSYPDARSDWQRERKFDSRFADMRAVQKWNRKRAFVMIVRSQFEIPVDTHDTRAPSQRIDAAFAALRDVDDHNALVRNLAARGAFQPKKRTDAVKFVVGDVVHVSDLGRGVVTGWTVARSHAFADLHVVYEILPHTGKHNRDAGRHHRVPQEDLELVETPKPVNNPSLLLYFDGFENGRHVPSAPLARRYPDDAAAVGEDSGSATADEQTVYTPSIMQLQFSDESKLLQYLRCEDATVIQFATAALEGKWIGASTEEAQNSVREALRMMDMGEFTNARDSLLRVVEEVDPEYAYAWTKLGMAEFRAGDAETALRYYETALEKNSQLLDALVGLGTCATKLRRWSVAHSAAVRLMRLQPNNDVARILLENALLSTL